jgi:hypothetical protein
VRVLEKPVQEEGDLIAAAPLEQMVGEAVGAEVEGPHGKKVVSC